MSSWSGTNSLDRRFTVLSDLGLFVAADADPHVHYSVLRTVTSEGTDTPWWPCFIPLVFRPRICARGWPVDFFRFLHHSLRRSAPEAAWPAVVPCT